MTIRETDFQLPEQVGFYRGKVRDVYYLSGERMAVVTTDRISAFDVVLPEPIPYKGQILNQIAWEFLEATRDIVPNWAESSPHPNSTFGKLCQPFAVEMVIRGYLTGHAYREYAAGKRTLCGVSLPEGMKENDPFPSPIITPTTKAHNAHDQDISREDILQRNIVSETHYTKLEQYTKALFQRGSELSKQKGLILVDTKYEFGLYKDAIHLIDEIHTPDSSRYFYAEGYQERQDRGKPQKQLSKEFVRQWLIDHGFQGKDHQTIPKMTPAIVQHISDRYVELYKQVLGKPFIPCMHNKQEDIKQALLNFLTK